MHDGGALHVYLASFECSSRDVYLARRADVRSPGDRYFAARFNVQRPGPAISHRKLAAVRPCRVGAANGDRSVRAAQATDEGIGIRYTTGILDGKRAGAVIADFQKAGVGPERARSGDTGCRRTVLANRSICV